METVLNELSTEMAVDTIPGTTGMSDNLRYLTIVCLAIGTIGVLGNVLVLLVIFHYTNMRKQLTNMFIINQSVADTVSSFLIIAKYTYNYITNYDITAFGSELLCRLWYTEVFLWSVFAVSTYNLVAVTIERYMKVVHPITHRNHFTKNKAVGIILLVWLWGAGFTSALSVPSSTISHSYCMVWSVWPNDDLRKTAGLANVVVYFFIPIIIMAFSYTHMIIVIRRRKNIVTVVVPSSCATSTANTASGDNPRNKNLSRAQKNLIKTMFMVTVCFVCCWSLNELWFLSWNLGLRASWQTFWAYQGLILMVFLNGCVNPFIYLFKYVEFQKGVKHLFCRG